jgi:hypothetical protein
MAAVSGVAAVVQLINKSASTTKMLISKPLLRNISSSPFSLAQLTGNPPGINLAKLLLFELLPEPYA